jgi:C4-type Zn-finger protein
MKDGFCPKCGSNDIHAYNASRKVPTKYFGVVFVSDYLCFNCGYMETYAVHPHALKKRLERRLRELEEDKPKRKNDQGKTSS